MTMMESQNTDGVVRRVTARGGVALPSLGLGTWRMGEDSSATDREVAALRLGLDMGMDLIDTAEMYADGGAERVVGEAIEGRRDAVTIVTKLHPANGSRQGVIDACEGSLKRLGTDRIDLYLLHWQGAHPLSETFDAFAQLVHEEKILSFGVSNFDRDAMVEAEVLSGGSGVVANQVLYNVNRRGIEWDLLPWCAERRVAVMAYSPLDDGKLAHRPGLNSGLSVVARRHGVKLPGRSRKLRDSDFSEFDLLVAMDEENERNMLRDCPEAHRHKIRRMREWDPEGSGDVPDPYYGGDRGFDLVYEMVSRSCQALLDDLES